MQVNGRIILASGSPRRLDLLKAIGLSVEVIRPEVEENVLQAESPRDFTLRASREKALNVYSRHGAKDAWIISADTTVVCGGKILNKPRDTEQAQEMLSNLSGRTHKVLTSFCIVSGNGKIVKTDTSTSFVTFREITADEIKWYVRSKEPLDKAGAYGAQGLGAIFITAIEGSYNNVVGLPLSALIDALIEVGAVSLK